MPPLQAAPALRKCLVSQRRYALEGQFVWSVVVPPNVSDIDDSLVMVTVATFPEAIRLMDILLASRRAGYSNRAINLALLFSLPLPTGHTFVMTVPPLSVH